MPTYAYACKSCGHRFDAVQSFSEPSLTVCPECGGALRKEYGSIGVTFNGSGFYRTDSRSGSGGGAGGSGEKKTADASSAGSGSSGGDGGAKTPPPTGSKTEAKASPAPSGS